MPKRIERGPMVMFTAPVFSLSASDIARVGFNTKYLTAYDVSIIARKLTSNLIDEYNEELTRTCKDLGLTQKGGINVT